MSDKTKVLSRKKQQNGSTTVVKYLICEFKKQIKSSLYSKSFHFSTHGAKKQECSTCCKEEE